MYVKRQHRFSNEALLKGREKILLSLIKSKDLSQTEKNKVEIKIALIDNAKFPF
jgi:hypothetical protein